MDGDATQARPANGGLRLWTYETEGAAVTEVERLASGMGAKHRMYNTGFSGGKLVCRAPCGSTLAEAVETKKGDILDAVAHALNSLDGSVYTGCDMNMSIPDMATLHKQTPYVLASLGGDDKMDAEVPDVALGDPEEVTACFLDL